ncbi:hypothetical protein AVEN_82288-1 [Araneus ventricosus]|uniref:Secreted protein n=1 Tax=Araneus ventricosus TaxID=182803 RepID=A0A4Y2RUJ3_ARAVE|nr:hypothetical protein AVEN_82288-1 [Araneus ventricosus]
MKNLLIVIGFWVTVGSNFFSHAREGETAPFCGSIRERLGENIPAGLTFIRGRGGLVVRSRLWGRRVPGSKPDSSEDPLCMGPATRQIMRMAKLPPVRVAWKLGDGGARSGVAHVT